MDLFTLVLLKCEVSLCVFVFVCARIGVFVCVYVCVLEDSN